MMGFADIDTYPGPVSLSRHAAPSVESIANSGPWNTPLTHP